MRCSIEPCERVLSGLIGRIWRRQVQVTATERLFIFMREPEICTNHLSYAHAM
jgi:hypothetical protein